MSNAEAAQALGVALKSVSKWRRQFAGQRLAGLDDAASAGRLVPVRVGEIPGERAPAVLRPLVSCDVSGVGEDDARRTLLRAVADPVRPGSAPQFPGRGGGFSRLGGSGPAGQEAKARSFAVGSRPM
jgi:hypothetical protein